MMPDVTEKNTEAAKRSAGTAADATRSTAQAAAETAGRGAETAAETARRAAELGRETAMSGLRAFAGAQGPLTDEGFEQSRRALEITARVTDVYRQAAERGADDVHALFDSWMSFGRGLQRWQQVYADTVRQSLESLATKQQALLQSDSPVRFAEVQRDLYLEVVGNSVQASTRLFELTGQIVQELVRPLRERAHAQA